MSKREVVKDLEYWARLAGAYKERRRIRRAIAPHLRKLSAARVLNRPPPWTMEWLANLADAIDRATKAPKRKAAKGTPR